MSSDANHKLKPGDVLFWTGQSFAFNKKVISSIALIIEVDKKDLQCALRVIEIWFTESQEFRRFSYMSYDKRCWKKL
jgi:hypothetical protein